MIIESDLSWIAEKSEEDKSYIEAMIKSDVKFLNDLASEHKSDVFRVKDSHLFVLAKAPGYKPYCTMEVFVDSNEIKAGFSPNAIINQDDIYFMDGVSSCLMSIMEV